MRNSRETSITMFTHDPGHWWILWSRKIAGAIFDIFILAMCYPGHEAIADFEELCQ
jgi:hypothetical protein